MAEPFVGEIRLMSFVYPPRYWALCNGQLLPINQNQALFSLLGTMYGGNGQTTFALPDLRGRVPLHMGAGFVQGESAGEESHRLTLAEMPQHTHTVRGSSTAATTNLAAGNALAGASNAYAGSGEIGALAPQAVSPAGGDQPHQNQQPYLTLSFCIALLGIFPSRD